MRTRLRLLAAGLLAAAMGVLGTGEAQALNPDSFTLTVTIGNQLSVRVRADGGSDLTNYNFGSMNYGQVSINTTEINIDNDSGGLQEDLQLSIGDAAGGLALETAAGALTADEYRVQALFQDAQPQHSDYGNEDILTTSAQSAQVSGAGSVFSKDSGTAAAEDGVDVDDDNRNAADSAEVRLWLRLELAGTGALSGVQSDFATVYVNAL